MSDPAFGLTSTGFVPKGVEDVEDTIDTKLRAGFGASLPLGPRTVLGVLDGIVAAEVGELWELAAAVNASQDPDGATGPSLVSLCALTGTRPKPALASKFLAASNPLTLTGDPGTTVSSGNKAATASTAAPFATTADATTVTLDSWAGTTGYSVGDRVTHVGSSVDRCYQCITTGVSAGSGGPVTETADETDGTVHWRFLGRGTAAVDVAAASVELGPVEAVSGDVTVIVTPVGGWLGVINLLDARLGALQETDEQLRLRREQELSSAGTAPPDAIRADLLEVPGVLSCTVFFNPGDSTDGDGLPPHSVEPLVDGGVDQDVVDQVFASVGAGIATYSSAATSGTATDSEGVDHTVFYTRPTDVPIWVDVTLVVDPLIFPSDGAAQVALAIVTFGNKSVIGRDAVATQLGAQAYSVPGVIDLPRAGSLGATLVKTSASPTSDANIVITRRQRATYDTSHVTLHVSNGTP